jgi:two-component system nitrogen regulation response regulator GlnG
LQNTLQRASVLATSDVLLPKDLPLGQVTNSAEVSDLSASPKIQGTAPTELTALTVEEAARSLFEALTRENGDRELLPWVEEDFTRRAMELSNNNQVKSSKLLGITRATLRKRLERLGIRGASSSGE